MYKISSPLSKNSIPQFWPRIIRRNESKVPFSPVDLYVGVERYILMPDGSNVFKVLMDKMAPFQSKLLRKTDDTVSFKLLIKVRRSTRSLCVFHRSESPIEMKLSTNRRRLNLTPSFPALLGVGVSAELRRPSGNGLRWTKRVPENLEGQLRQ